MKIQRAVLTNFSVFENVRFDFCPGINVLIGENATGKSHLLKLLYSVLKSAEQARKNPEGQSMQLTTVLAQKLLAVFRPDGGLQRIVHRRRGRTKATVALRTDSGDAVFTLSSLGNIQVTRNKLGEIGSAIFIPAREMFSAYEGFLAAVENRDLAFDDTYRDLCVALSAAPARGPRLAQASDLARPLEDILGGSVELQGEKFLVNMQGSRIEAHLLAEGMRKIATLLRLIVNGSLAQQGFLFWDEPEANLNPKLVKKVAELISSLAGAGVQVFLATHDFLLSQELSLAAEYKVSSGAEIRFFGLTRTNDGGPVEVETGRILADLRHNPILEAFNAHYDRERELFSQSEPHAHV